MENECFPNKKSMKKAWKAWAFLNVQHGAPSDHWCEKSSWKRKTIRAVHLSSASGGKSHQQPSHQKPRHQNLDTKPIYCVVHQLDFWDSINPAGVLRGFGLGDFILVTRNNLDLVTRMHQVLYLLDIWVDINWYIYKFEFDSLGYVFVIWEKNGDIWCINRFSMQKGHTSKTII